MTDGEQPSVLHVTVYGTVVSSDELLATYRQQVLDAYGFKAWQVGFGPAPRMVRWTRPLRRAWYAVKYRGDR